MEDHGIVYDVKAKIHHTLGIPPNQQSFIYAGHVLENGRMLSECYIHEDVTLQLVVNIGA
jgi:hypothetical protein